MTAQPNPGGFHRRTRLFRRSSAAPRPATPRTERRDGQGRIVTQLLRALGAGWTVTDSSSQPWCSATFIGAQHRLTLTYEGANAIDRARADAKRLPALDFRVAGHVVVDLSVDAAREHAPGLAQVEIALLTVEDW